LTNTNLLIELANKVNSTLRVKSGLQQRPK